VGIRTHETVEHYYTNGKLSSGKYVKTCWRIFGLKFSCHVKALKPAILSGQNLKIKIYKTVILPVVLYGCETWSFTLREEHRLRVFENRVLRRIFGTERDEDGSWRKLHNDEIRNLYFSPNIVRVIK